MIFYGQSKGKHNKNFNSVKDYANQQTLFDERQQAISDIISVFDEYKTKGETLRECIHKIFVI